MNALTVAEQKALANVGSPWDQPRRVETRTLASIARDLASLNAVIEVHPGRHAYAPDAMQDACCDLETERLDLERQFQAAFERETGVSADAVRGVL